MSDQNTYPDDVPADATGTHATGTEASIPTPEEPTFPAPDEPTVPAPDEPTAPAPTEPAAPTAPAADGEMLGGTEGGGDSAVKDPENWVTGDEPMTGPQRSYIDTLAREAGEEIPANLTKAEASEQIDRLQSATGRGA